MSVRVIPVVLEEWLVFVADSLVFLIAFAVVVDPLVEGFGNYSFHLK